MDYLKKHRYKKITFGIVGNIIIPLYAYLFALNGPDGNLRLVTFSQIGSRYGFIESLILWGIMSSIYYFAFLDYLLFLTGYKNVFLEINLALSCLSMLVTVFLPFAPSMFPMAAKTHNFLARIAAISFVLTILIFITAYLKIDKKVFLKAIIVFAFVLGINIFSLILFGVSSLFQIILSATLCPFLFINLIFLEKSKHFNVFTVLEKAEQEKQSTHDIF